jgi:DNA-binding NarL/FixJ family response regulator
LTGIATTMTTTARGPQAGTPAPQRTIRIAIVEDESLFRDLLRTALAQYPGLEVVGAFGDGEQAVRDVPGLRPDVVLMDIELGGQLNGIQAAMLLRRQLPELGIVLLSNQGSPRVLSSLPPDALSGWSYLLKQSVRDIASLYRAIEGAASGLMVLDPQLVASRRARSGGALERLTPRQREILGLVAQGYTNAAIAEKLVVATKTVEKQLNLLYQELGVDRNTSAAHPRVRAVLTYIEESQPEAPWTTSR